ncbi:ABC transporter substrate-binding protein [Rugamonas sp.]|uniref:substrate-binding periplasmic protein n=1 Tax=Rugamonas sp. TaxID=1926287 RepID=UPI0025E1D167|nr:transporter substrate-binding domain-containing protein [Rugamonas sp.]
MRFVLRLLPLLMIAAAGMDANATASANANVAAEPPPLVFIAPTNHAMPMARFENGELSGGMLKDLGELIAQRLGRRPVFISRPSRRVSDTLSSGQADAVCYVLPNWLTGSYHWSQPLIANGGIVVARGDAPVLRTIADLADKPVGTITGYRYPEIEAALGSHFARDDAPTMEHNFRKLDIGRMQYALTEPATLSYRMRMDPQAHLRSDIVFNSFKAQCAFSLKSTLPFAQVDRAINGLVGDGSIQTLLDRYR